MSTDAAARPGPRVGLDYPEDWEQVEAPGVLIAVRDAAPGTHFRANVVVRYFTREAGFTPGDALAELDEHVAGKRDGAGLEPFEATINGVGFVGRTISYNDDEAGTVTQVHLFTGGRNGAATEIVQVTGSVAGTRVEQDLPLVRIVIETLSLTAP